MGAIYTNTRQSMNRFHQYWRGFSWSSSSSEPDLQTNIPSATLWSNQGVKGGGSNSIIKDSVTSFRTKNEDTLINDSAAARALLADQISKNDHDTGHEFDLRRYYVKSPSRMVDFRGVGITGGYWHYSGPFRLARFDPIVSSSTDFSGLGTWAFDPNFAPNVDPIYGTKAIQASSPAKRNANLAVALTEILRDGLPDLPGRALKKSNLSSAARSTSEEYLNYIFGWVPTISDIRQVLTAMVYAPKIINQYAKDSDKIVRRRFAFPPIDETLMGAQTYSGGGSQVGFIHAGLGLGSNPIGYFNNGNSVTGTFRTKSEGSLVIDAVQRTQTNIWFSGAFRYHLSAGDNVFSRLNRTSQLAGKLLGLRLDLETFWTAMPWSWFVDWFADIGSIIANANASFLDGQVLQYGYLMRSDTQSRTFTTREPIYFKQAGRETNLGNPTTTYVSQRKQRIRATPFGFGLNPNTFTAQQWAILGALGLTKAPQKLF